MRRAKEFYCWTGSQTLILIASCSMRRVNRGSRAGRNDLTWGKNGFPWSRARDLLHNSERKEWKCVKHKSNRASSSCLLKGNATLSVASVWDASLSEVSDPPPRWWASDNNMVTGSVVQPGSKWLNSIRNRSDAVPWRNKLPSSNSTCLLYTFTFVGFR